MTEEHKIIPSEEAGLPAGGYYANFSDVEVKQTVPTEAGQKAAIEALEIIKDRSYAGRNPELGKMVNCPFCDTRHRENDPLLKCKQKFATETRDGDPLQGELIPPDGMTQLTARQHFGAKMFDRRRQRPRNKPKNKMHHWLRAIIDAKKRKNADLGAGSETPES